MRVCSARSAPSSPQRVVDSRLTEPGDSIRRRRECARCGNRFTTYERVEGPVVSVAQARRQQRALRPPEAARGLVRAAGKRPVSDAAARGAGRVDRGRRAGAAGGGRGPSRSATSPSAGWPASTPSPAIQFASVYRDLADLDELEAVVRRFKESPSPGPTSCLRAPRLRSVRSGEQHRSFPLKADGRSPETRRRHVRQPWRHRTEHRRSRCRRHRPAPFHRSRARTPSTAVEWEIRDAVIGDPANPAFEQRGVEFPATWSQNATNIVAQKYFRGRMDSPERESSVKQMIGRVAGTIAGWGRDGGYFATRRGRRGLRGRAHPHPAPPDGGVQLAGLVQRRLRGEPAVLGVLHPLGRGHDRVDPRLEHQGGHDLPRRLRLRDQPLEHPRLEGAALQGRARRAAPSRFMRGADAWAGTIKSGGKTRRAAKMVVLDVDHPDVLDFIWCKAREEEKAAALRDAGFDMRLDSEAFASIQYQNANNSVRVSDEFMERAERGEDWELTARIDGARDRDASTRASCSSRSPTPRGAAPTRASSTTRRSTTGTPARTRAGSTPPTPAASTCTSTTRRATSPRSTSSSSAARTAASTSRPSSTPST